MTDRLRILRTAPSARRYPRSLAPVELYSARVTTYVNWRVSRARENIQYLLYWYMINNLLRKYIKARKQSQQDICLPLFLRFINDLMS